MNTEALNSLATVATQAFAAVAPTLTLTEFGAACKLRLAAIQGTPGPSYDRSEAAYNNMIRQAYRIHCQRAAEKEAAVGTA